MLAKHVGQHVWVFAGCQHKPWQRNDGKQQQATHPRQGQNFSPLPGVSNPNKEHQTGQQQTNQSFAQNAQCTRHKPPTRPACVHACVVHEGTRETPNSHTHPRRHHHVVVHVLATHEKRQAATKHPCSTLCHLRTSDVVRTHPHQPQHQTRMHSHHQARSPRRSAQHAHHSGFQPIQQRRFVKERNAV